MTAAAREVLLDCRSAVASLVDGVQGDEWRRTWVLAVVLLRTVGHVLHKVDGAQSAALKRAIDEWWHRLTDSRPQPALFWQFIEEERNLILKQYQIRAGYNIKLQVPLWHFFPAPTDSEPPATTEYRYMITSGPFEGEDQRDVLKKAVDWWEEQLSAIEGVASGA